MEFLEALIYIFVIREQNLANVRRIKTQGNHLSSKRLQQGSKERYVE